MDKYGYHVKDEPKKLVAANKYVEMHNKALEERENEDPFKKIGEYHKGGKKTTKKRRDDKKRL